MTLQDLSVGACPRVADAICGDAKGPCKPDVPTTRRKALSVKTLPSRILDAKYAVRGEVLDKANELQQLLNSGNHILPFKKLVPCNIGNPQAVGGKPITFHRQLLSLLAEPSKLASAVEEGFPADVVERAEQYLKHFPKFGAYSESRGVAFLRQEVANFIGKRDGTAPPGIENIYLTDGASTAIVTILEMLVSGPTSGILVPVPGYPLYSGTIVRQGGRLIGYELVEEERWDLSPAMLEASIEKARKEGLDVKGLVVINPGNPTGNVLTRERMEAVVRLCEREGLVLLADEVYQENIWKERPFISFRSVALSINSSAEVVSFHSISKGFYGECGLRGGYMELLNVDPEVNQQLYKLRSMGLCPNTLGQAMMASIVNPPAPGSPSWPLYQEERDQVLASMKRKSEVVYKVFNSMEGVSAQPIDGAMYVFPSISLPESYVERAKASGRAPDLQYALDMLSATGVVVVPGSGFGQKEGTYHYRMTILPQEAEFPEMLERIRKFHASVLQSA